MNPSLRGFIISLCRLFMEIGGSLPKNSLTKAHPSRKLAIIDNTILFSTSWQGAICVHRGISLR